MRTAPRTARSGVIACVAIALLVTQPAIPSAHEIPSNVIVRAFVKPEGERLRFLVRAPLGAMRDIDFPLRDTVYLDIARADEFLRDAATVWIARYVRIYEQDRLLPPPRIAAIRVSLPANRSFDSYENALTHVNAAPLPADTRVPWQQALLDVLLEYPISSDSAEFSIDPGLAHLGLRTTTVLRFLPPGTPERAFEYIGDPGRVRLDPRWHHAALLFVKLGFDHILDGIDHLLFVFCLVIPFRRLRALVPIVTSFTVAHSITLIASAAGLAPDALWFPPLIETLIALSIVYMAFENIVGPRLERRWLIAFGFGLVHGFGFSFILRDSLQFAGPHLISSLLAFNVGVELGQLAVLVVAIPLLQLLFRHVVAERMGTILLSALVAHSAWHWMVERGSTLPEYQYAWPALDLALAASFVRWLMLALIIAGAGWVASVLARRFAQPKREETRIT